MQSAGPSDLTTPSPSPFPATWWTLVLDATGAGDPARAQDTLRELCGIYRQPIVEWLRHRGYGQNAEDSADDFMAFMLERNRLQNFARGKAKFRSYLLECLRHFLNDTWRKQAALKRGGGVENLSFDELEIGERQEFESRIDQGFAKTVHVQAMRRLERKYSGNGSNRFQELRRFVLGNDSTITYAEVAPRLGLNPNSVKKAVFDMRELYCDYFREEVSQTVARSQIDEEMRYLLTLLAEIGDEVPVSGK